MNRGRRGLVVFVGATGLLLAGASWHGPKSSPAPRSWNKDAAATYLDTRLVAWTYGGAMDHGTFCVSCHTGLPYGLGRPTCGSSDAERQLIDSVTKRVRMWNDVQPYLGDKRAGKSTEAVINALLLASRDAQAGHLSALARKAFGQMWSYEDASGAWPWANFGNEPWEAPDSEYWGATVALVAAGTAPDGYIHESAIRDGVVRLEAYVRKESPGRSLFNRLGEIWAASKVPDLLTRDEKATLEEDVLAKQHPDGGWDTASLLREDWRRHDGTAQATESDGYATGLAAFVLREAGLPKSEPEMARARVWLINHQDPTSGAWPTASPNAKRDPSSEVGKFMTDAATAYAVLALSEL